MKKNIKIIIYRKEKILPIFIGNIDTNKATQLGAYAYAINQLENKEQKKAPINLHRDRRALFDFHEIANI